MQPTSLEASISGMDGTPARRVDLRDTSTFPSYEDCPYDDDADLRYYNFDGGYASPHRHWCFLGEIHNKPIPYDHPHLNVRDTSGAVVRVTFYGDEDRAMHYFAGPLKKGYTVAILYANKLNVMDMRVGFRINLKAPATVKVFPFSLDALLTANDKIHEPPPAKCWVEGCEKTDNLARCSMCHKAQYCGRDHQAAAWKDGHRAECKVFTSLEWFLEKDWTRFRGFWDF